MPRKRARIGIEIGPEAVRAVALLGWRMPLVLGEVAEERVAGFEEVPAALAEVLGRIGERGNVHLVLLGIHGHHLRLRFPPMRRGELEQALDLHLARALDDARETLLRGRRVRRLEDGSLVVDVLALPRDPVETWCSQLAASGFPVTWIQTPAAAVLERDPRPEDARATGLLWVDAGGTRTVLTFLKGDEIVLVREIPRKDIDPDDQLARIERRLADFQEIERSLLYYRQHHDRAGVRELVLSGDPDEVNPLHEQIAPPLRELEIGIRIVDAWDGVDRSGADLPAGTGVRLALAGRAAATPPGRGLGIVPPMTIAARRRELRDRILAGTAAAALVLSAGLAWHGTAQNAVLREQLAAERARLASLPAPAGEQADRAVEVRPPRAPDWSGVLSEIGVLARPGIDYDELELVITADGPVVGLVGTAEGRDTRATGLLLAGLHEGVLSSSYSRGIPRLSASTAPGARRGEKVRYALEGSVEDRPSTPAEPTGAIREKGR